MYTVNYTVCTVNLYTINHLYIHVHFIIVGCKLSKVYERTACFLIQMHNTQQLVTELKHI